MADRPTLKRWNLQYTAAFDDLSPSRSYSETPHPLKFADIITYGKLIGILNSSDLLFFYRMIRVCDEAYLTYYREKKEAETPPAKTP